MRNVKDNSKYNLSQQEIQDLDQKIESLTPSEKKVANYYFGTSNIRQSIFVSQTLVAKKLGVCRATVNRTLKLLHQLGIITKIDRGWKEDRTRIKKTCYYMINKLFFYQEIRNRYKHIFLSLSYLVIFCNFESIFGIWSQSERQQHNSFVTGIKSSLNSLFKNKEEGYLGYRGNRIRRRRQGIREGLQEDSNLTIEEGSTMSEFIQSLGGFNEPAKLYLSGYRDEIVKEAIRGLGKARPTGNAWLYFLKILTRVSLSKNMEPDYGIINSVAGIPQLTLPITGPSLIASSSTPGFRKKEEEKKYVPRKEWQPTEISRKKETAMQLVQNLAKASQMFKEGNEFAKYAIKGISEMEYETTGEENEDKTIYYINQKKKEFESVLSLAGRLKELGMGEEEPDLPKPEPTPQRDRLLKMLREQRVGYTIEQEPSKPTTENNVNTVTQSVNSSLDGKNKQGSPIDNEMDYEEVYD